MARNAGLPAQPPTTTASGAVRWTKRTAQLSPPGETGRYRQQLLRYARSRLRNPAHSKDAAQEALVAALAVEAVKP